MPKTLIGYGYTDENGVATLDYDAEGHELAESGYVADTVGNYNLTAETEIDGETYTSSPSQLTVNPNTYEVLDCLFMDYKGDGTKNTNWTKSLNPTVTYSDGETTIKSTGTGMYFSNQILSGDFEAILECKLGTGSSAVRVGFSDTNTTSFNKNRKILYNFDEYRYLKFRREGSTWTASRSSDGTRWNNYTEWDASSLTTEDCYFFFHIYIPTGNVERSITYKNLKIYPI